MFALQTGTSASFKATFPGAKQGTVYRKGEKTVIKGCTLRLTLDNREGVFVPVEA